jgi:lipoate-protein ligase A
MVVLALVTEVAALYRNQEYARIINSWVIEALANLGIRGVTDKGIADLASGEQKLLGCSLYRQKHLLFYQGSLLVDSDLSLFTRYLTFPSRVPAYREGRSHLDFCTTLKALGHKVTTKQIIEQLEMLVLRYLPAYR